MLYSPRGRKNNDEHQFPGDAMRNVSFQIIIGLVTLLMSIQLGWAEDWTLYHTSDESQFYYDKNSIKEVEKNIVLVWTKTMLNEKGKTKISSVLKNMDKETESPEIWSRKLILLNLDCADQKYKMTSMHIYDEKGSELFSLPEITYKWRDIIKNSANEKLKNIVCSFFNTSPIPPASPASREQSLDWFNKASTLWNGEQYTDPQKAIEYLDTAISHQPDNAYAHNSRGVAYKNLDRLEQAIENYTEAIRLQKDYAYAYNNRGIAYKKLGKYESAMEDFNQAIQLKSDYAEAYNNRAMTYLEQGNKQLGCNDARNACHWGQCRLLKFYISKGLCRDF
jgi:tetratricopeptide (TPR) repeat protein